VVHSAGIQDRVGARALLLRLAHEFGTITHVFADGGYTGKLVEWAKEMFHWNLTIVKRTDKDKFVVLPKRWVVERTFAWLGCSRRSSKDYEVLPTMAEAFIKISMVRTLLLRLVPI
jgi:transposase